MTNADSSPEERRLDDERCVDGLLTEAGLPGDAELRDMLLELRNLRRTEVPEPSAELATLMGQSGAADVIRLEERPRKRSRKKRAVFTALAIAASLGVAGGAAAGNDGLRSTAEGTISSIVGSLFPSSPAKPAPAPPTPAPPTPAPKPAPTPTPAPAVVLPSPAGAVPAPVPGPELAAGDGRQDSQTSQRGPQMPHGRETGREGAAGQTGEKPAQPGASRAAEVPPPADDQPGNDGPRSEPPADDRAVKDRPSGAGAAPDGGSSADKAVSGGGTQGAGESRTPPAGAGGR